MAGILIVDDAAFVRMTIKQMLEAHGYSVVGEAANGLEAVKMFSLVKPDLVMLDITMPEMDGIEALKQIKQIDSGAKIIICSAMGQQERVAQAIQFGATDFIVKPFKEDRIIASVEKVLGK